MQNAAFPVIKDIVLIGGGHAHVGVLRSFGMFPIKGARLTLISPEVDTPYSGMLPGLIAGHYTFDEAHIDLGPLARFAGARYLATHVTGIDPERRLIHCADGRPPIAYDVASIDIGSTPIVDPDLELTRQPLPVKPVSKFLASWADLKARAHKNPNLRIAVVGAGAGGVELLLSMQYALATEAGAVAGRGPGRFVLATRDDKILATHGDKVRKALEDRLTERNVEIRPNFEARRFGESGISDGTETIPIDEAVWVTGAAPARWFRDTGLALDERGFIAVDENLQSTSHANLFGAGDCVTMVASPRPKSGVFAVRQGPILTKNLRAVVLARPLQRYKPQKRFLSLISTGDRSAVASWGNWFQQGNWVWRWKDNIDTKFVKKFNDLPRMEQIADTIVPTVANISEDLARDLAPGAMRCKGCGSKVAGDVLSRVLARLDNTGAGKSTGPGQAIAVGPGDDAAAFEVSEGKVLVQTVDQFASPLSDPYQAGRITAQHCLNDIYAMGATPHSALAIITLPLATAEKQEHDLEQAMAGAEAIFSDAGCRIIGGHTSEGGELILGFTINGLIDAADLKRKATPAPGNALILTRAIGTGALFAAAAVGHAKGRNIQKALYRLTQSNAKAAEILIRHGATALTDVTGFGLAGHLAEMIRPLGLEARITLADIPLFDGARDAASAGIVSSLHAGNARAAAPVDAETALTKTPAFQLLYDPQTAGGLLAALPRDRVGDAIAELEAAGEHEAAQIGNIEQASTTARIRVV